MYFIILLLTTARRRLKDKSTKANNYRIEQLRMIAVYGDEVWVVSNTDDTIVYHGNVAEKLLQCYNIKTYEDLLPLTVNLEVTNNDF